MCSSDLYTQQHKDMSERENPRPKDTVVHRLYVHKLLTVRIAPGVRIRLPPHRILTF